MNYVYTVVCVCNKLQWLSLIEGFFKEAQWYYSGYTPTLEEYLNNAKVSISSPTIISQVYFTLATSTEKTVIESVYGYHNILYLSGMILRLADDLGTTQVYFILFHYHYNKWHIFSDVYVLCWKNLLYV